MPIRGFNDRRRFRGFADQDSGFQRPAIGVSTTNLRGFSDGHLRISQQGQRFGSRFQRRNTLNTCLTPINTAGSRKQASSGLPAPRRFDGRKDRAGAESAGTGQGDSQPFPNRISWRGAVPPSKRQAGPERSFTFGLPAGRRSFRRAVRPQVDYALPHRR